MSSSKTRLSTPLFEELERHFCFGETGITDKVVEAWRVSAYFVPIPPSKKKSGQEQLVLGTEWTKDRQKKNKLINHIRNTMAKWRFGGYDGVTNTTRALLEYWQRPERERKLAAEVAANPRLERKTPPGSPLFDHVVAHLRRGLSPEQIVFRLRSMPEPVRPSDETI